MFRFSLLGLAASHATAFAPLHNHLLGPRNVVLKAQQAISFVCSDDTSEDPASLSAGLLSDTLSELGATSVTVTDQCRGTDAETPVFRHHKNSPTWRGGKGVEDPAFGRTDEFGVVDETTWQPSRLWKESLVTATFPSEWAPDTIAEMLQQVLGLDTVPVFSVTDVDENIDWVKTVQESWAPIRVGNVLVRFPWHDAATVDAYYTSEAAAAAMEVVDVPGTQLARAPYQLELEGGVAFGTGEHPTTVLCLKWLHAQAPGKSVLDYGAGSGILGLAALALGASTATGVEVDHDAIEAAHRNAANNNLPFACYLPPAALAHTSAGGAGMGAGMGSEEMLADGTSAASTCEPLPQSMLGTFDVCVANILAGPLTQLAPTVAKHCKLGAKLALSGVLTEQGEKVCAAYQPFFSDIQVTKESEGWLLLTGTRSA